MNCFGSRKNYHAVGCVISVGSHYKTEQFAEGGNIQLLTPTGGGTYSIIEKIDHNKLVGLSGHIDEIKDFQEQTINQATETWRNAMESYELKNSATGTELTVQVDTMDISAEFMKNSFPFALQVVKKWPRIIEVTAVSTLSMYWPCETRESVISLQ